MPYYSRYRPGTFYNFIVKLYTFTLYFYNGFFFFYTFFFLLFFFILFFFILFFFILFTFIVHCELMLNNPLFLVDETLLNSKLCTVLLFRRKIYFKCTSSARLKEMKRYSSAGWSVISFSNKKKTLYITFTSKYTVILSDISRFFLFIDIA